jgi:hypothetical protein
MITPSRTSLADCQSSRMLHFSADYRAQQREGMGGGSTMLRITKKFSRAEPILRLRSIGNNPVANVSHVPHDAVVEVEAPYSLLLGSAQDVPRAEMEADKGKPADVDEPADGGEVAEGVDAGGEVAEGVDAGGEVAEGVDAGVSAEQTADEVVSALAMDDPSLFSTAFAEAVAASGPDPDDSPMAAPTAGLNDDAKWDKYPLGLLPDEKDPDVPLDIMAGGLRYKGGTLASLFEVGVVGTIAPLTCVGAMVE